MTRVCVACLGPNDAIERVCPTCGADYTRKLCAKCAAQFPPPMPTQPVGEEPDD